MLSFLAGNKKANVTKQALSSILEQVNVSLVYIHHCAGCWRYSGEQNRHRLQAHRAKLLVVEMTITERERKKKNEFQRTEKSGVVKGNI